MSKEKEMLKAKIKHMISTNPAWTEKAIIALYNYQTAYEQNIENTVEHNSVGFNAPDAHRLTYYAKWIRSGKHLTGHHLTKAQSMIKKYSGQLVEIAAQNNPDKLEKVKTIVVETQGNLFQ